MIEGGWSFVVAAYAITATALVALIAIILWRWAVWARRARELEQRP